MPDERVWTFRKYPSNIPGKHGSRNCRRQPYWVLRKFFGKYVGDSISKLQIQVAT
jgi:hypothetical protein